MSNYRVLVRDWDFKELTSLDFLSYDDAIEKFRFLIDCTLVFKLNVRVINLFKGKRCVKLFENQKPYYYGKC